MLAMSDHKYLGTHLTPQEYYKRHASRYHNPHAEGIAEVLGRVGHHLHHAGRRYSDATRLTEVAR